MICSEPAVQLAMERQLQQRGHVGDCVTPAQLIEGLDALLDDSGDTAELLVLDLASREQFHSGHPEWFSEAAFQRLVAVCRQRGWPLLMLSDSRVFPGGGKQRYRESDTPAPLPGGIGAELLRREQHLATQLERHVIVRSGPLIATVGDNLLTRQVRNFRRGGLVTACGEPRFSPTPMDDLARVIAGIHDQLNCAARCWGIYHYHSSDAATGYEFAEVVLAAAAQYWDVGGKHVQLQAVATPADAVFPLLSCHRIRDTFGIQQLPWRKAIPELMKQIYEGESA
jgi:dTDP-4-dehydrorhamnose reductase